MLDLRPLRSAGFRHLAATYCVNELGNWVGEVALAILVFDRTRSPLAVAALFLAARVLPAAVAPVLTAHVESGRARRSLSTLYIAEALFFASIALVTRHFSLPLVLALVAADGALASVTKALTRSAIATDLMPIGLLREGNGIVNLVQVVSAAAGPALAGVLVAWKGAGVALLIDAGTFVAAALVIGLGRGIRIESDEEAGTWGRMRAGLSVLRDRPVVRRLIFAFGVTMLLGSVAVPVEVVFAKSTLHAGDSGYGALLGCWGLGMVVGGIAFVAAAEIRLVTVFGISTMVMALGYGGLAAAPSLTVACAFSAVGGIGNGAAMVSLLTAVQEQTPVSTQSTVVAVLGGLDQVMPGIGFVAGGAVTALTSPRVAYGISAAGLAVVVLALSIWRIDRIRLTEVHQTADDNGHGTTANRSEIDGIPEARTQDRAVPISKVNLG